MHHHDPSGLTLIEILLAIGAAAIALAAVAYFSGYFDSDKAAGAKVCQEELTKAEALLKAWKATTSGSDKVGSYEACTSARTAADAWNKHCSNIANTLLPVPTCTQ